MRFLMDVESYQVMLQRNDHTPDCYVRPGEYLHHLYVEGVKYVVAPAVSDCLQKARSRDDKEAVRHLQLHEDQLATLIAQAGGDGATAAGPVFGDAPPAEAQASPARNDGFVPRSPKAIEDTGLTLPFVFEMVLRVLYNYGRLTGAEIATRLHLPFATLSPVLAAMRRQLLIDMTGQKGGALGDAAIEYEVKPPKGAMALEDALKKSEYLGPTPVTFEDYVEGLQLQNLKRLVVTRRSIREAFHDLVITDAVFNEIGPAINSAQSIFLFGYPGNGKTSIAERITRLMGDTLYIPYAIECGGQIIKLYDPTVHQAIEEEPDVEVSGSMRALLKGPQHDQRWIKVKRPTIVVGGELTMQMLDLKYNPIGKFYEAPLHMKANGGIFMIDDFGRQQVRPMDLLNRWIIPLEKRYDYLTTVSGTKIEIPFEQLLIFSTNLDPNQLADEAFLRRIKFKIEVRDPDERQWREIWRKVCAGKGVECDERGLDYLVEKWYRATGRPFRMCQPRDLLSQMQCIASYNMERVTFNPDLIDAACLTYFVSDEKKNFGAKVRLE